MDEGQTYDKKSLLTFASDPKRWDWKKIAKHCVAFANANGGLLDFGLEDDQSEPPPEQRIPPALAEKLRKGIGHQCVNVAVTSSVRTCERICLGLIAQHGSRYFIVTKPCQIKPFSLEHIQLKGLFCSEK